MPCDACNHIVDIENLDQPHIIRRCSACGRKMHIYSPGKHGIGIKANAGDQFVIPKDWITLHANPLKGRGRLSKAGLIWFAKFLLLGDLPKKENDIGHEIEKNEKLCDTILSESGLLKGVDINDPDDSEKMFKILSASKESAEWWAFLFGLFNYSGKEAIEKNDAKKAAWSMACAERCRSMLIFKQDLEEVVWMGHSAKRIVDVLQLWDGNQKNADEEFWQIKFNENSYVLSQIFSVPVVFIQDKAYVGGMHIDKKDAKFVDYLFSSDTTNEAILIEIKTPTTKLIGAKYRSVYKPSAELSGTIVQAGDYKATLMQNISAIAKDSGRKISAFNPRCLVIAGNTEDELDDATKRKSFELFRAQLQGIEIITYDELFKKIEVLATLFNLIRKKDNIEDTSPSSETKS